MVGGADLVPGLTALLGATLLDELDEHHDEETR